MFKKIGTFIVVVLVVVGALNFHALNAPAFKSITETMTTEAIGDIPGKVFSTVTSYQWKFVRS
jgi:hypothetical protein